MFEVYKINRKDVCHQISIQELIWNKSKFDHFFYNCNVHYWMKWYCKYTKEIKVDGGASKNDFMMQLVAELTGKTILRMPSSDMSAVGVGLMAGIQANVWSNRDSLNQILLPNKIFKANFAVEEKRTLISRYRTWKKACKHFSGFYARP